MADYIQRLREIEQLETNVQRNVPPRRVLGDMNNPLEYLTDEQFRSRYRLRKASYRHLLEYLHDRGATASYATVVCIAFLCMWNISRSLW